VLTCFTFYYGADWGEEVIKRGRIDGGAPTIPFYLSTANRHGGRGRKSTGRGEKERLQLQTYTELMQRHIELNQIRRGKRRRGGRERRKSFGL